MWKGLKARGKAISTALDHYNTIAPLMDPPAPHLGWAELVDYTFIAEFELLKYSSSFRDITAEPWAVPGNREMTTKYFKLVGAYAELHRCNYETRRLRTSIRDEQQDYIGHIARVQPSDPDLASEIQQQANSRTRVHAYILLRLNAIEDIKEFSGARGCGVRCGAMDVDEVEASSPSHAAEEAVGRAQISLVEIVATEGLVEDEMGGMDDEEDVRDRLIEFSDAITQELPSTNTVPNSMLFSWKL